MRNTTDETTVDVSGEFVSAFRSLLPQIVHNTQTQPAHQNREGAVEQKLIQASLHGPTDVAFIDRQVQPRRTTTSQRADLVGLTRDGRFILGEVKFGLNQDIQHLVSQVKPYYDMMVDSEGRLNDEFTTVYRLVVKQKHALGVLPETVCFPDEPPPVECLVVLCDHDGTGELLARLRKRAAGSEPHIGLVFPAEPDYSVPPMSEWERL